MISASWPCRLQLLLAILYLCRSVLGFPYSPPNITIPTSSAETEGEQDTPGSAGINWIYPVEGKDFPIGGTSDLVIRYYARRQMTEFKLLPEGAVETCVADALKLIDGYITGKALNPDDAYFDPDKPGVEGGKFICPDLFYGDGVGIRFRESEKYGKISVAGAKLVLDGMSRAATIGFTETAIIVIYQQTGPLLVAGYGMVDLVATVGDKEIKWPAESS